MIGYYKKLLSLSLSKGGILYLSYAYPMLMDKADMR